MIEDNDLPSAMKIIVTGGAGFIGSNLVDFLLDLGHKVIIVDDFSTGKFGNIAHNVNRVTIIKDKVENVMFESLDEIDAVIHLAAQASVPLSVSDFKKSSATNLMSSINVIDFCSAKQIPLVYASSSAIYGGLELGNDQGTNVDLLSPYAVDKFAMEVYANVASKLHNLSSIGLRFFNVYGPRQDPSSPYSGVISIFVDRMVKNKPITINGGYQTRDFVYVDDVITCIYKSLIKTCSAPASDYVNILTGVSTSIDTLVEILSKKLRYSGVKEYKPLEKGDVELSTGTQEKMMRLLNLNHTDFIELEVGLKNTVDFLKKDIVND